MHHEAVRILGLATLASLFVSSLIDIYFIAGDSERNFRWKQSRLRVVLGIIFVILCASTLGVAALYGLSE